jgi:hypothetical protein
MLWPALVVCLLAVAFANGALCESIFSPRLGVKIGHVTSTIFCAEPSNSLPGYLCRGSAPEIRQKAWNIGGLWPVLLPSSPLATSCSAIRGLSSRLNYNVAKGGFLKVPPRRVQFRPVRVIRSSDEPASSSEFRTVYVSRVWGRILPGAHTPKPIRSLLDPKVLPSMRF